MQEERERAERRRASSRAGQRVVSARGATREWQLSSEAEKASRLTGSSSFGA